MKRLVLLAPVFVLLLNACSRNEPRFTLLKPSETGVRFQNTITETDSFNVFTFEYIYNGGGVGIGDFNTDGLMDIFFAGNQQSSQLYLNRGNFQFEDITESSGVKTKDWITGVAVADINQDGAPDIYLSTAYPNNKQRSANLLYINLGTDAKGLPKFRESAGVAGLADSSYGSQAVFLDYDKDGDMDIYLCTNSIKESDRNALRGQYPNGKGLSLDKLYRNEGLQPGSITPIFKDVSFEAGIRTEGWGLGVIARDFNGDGWTDVYVGNDFQSNDHLYINNQDGTFSNQVGTFFAHQSHNSMGVDMADANNDGLEDLVVVDMLPDDNLRRKTMFGAIPNDRFESALRLGYQPQYVRNVLQINGGPVPGKPGQYHFSDLGQLAGVEGTDWSWSPLWLDANLDGKRDLLITNGYVKDITDLDFASYSTELGQFGSAKENMQKLRKKASELGEVRKPNFFFENTDRLTFANRAESWGMDQPSFSNGAAYADLDNDGDLDIVMNNLNDDAFVYRNNTLSPTIKDSINTPHFIGFQLQGNAGNRDGLNAKIALWYGGEIQYTEQGPQRGYLSTMDPRIVFGLGKRDLIDSVVIYWNSGKKTILKNPSIDRYHLLREDLSANSTYPKHWPLQINASWFRADSLTFRGYVRYEEPFNDFNYQFTLPHRFSIQGPPLCNADVNGDGKPDFYVGGSSRQPGAIFLSNGDTFNFYHLPADSISKKIQEETAAAFFDADMDGDLDLICIAGGNQFLDPEGYDDLIYLNNGKGIFVKADVKLPGRKGPGSCLALTDYDRDGDMDLFIGGYVAPQRYPLAVASVLLRNDAIRGENRLSFTDMTETWASGLSKPGLVKDAVWKDFNGDGREDLLLAGAFMPLKIWWQSPQKKLEPADVADFQFSAGWYQSLLVEDFDQDGDMDIVAGNQGLNSVYKASEKEPLTVRYRDFNGDSRLDAFLFQYHMGREVPVQTRTQYVDQITGLRKRIYYFRDFGMMGFQDIFQGKEREGVDSLRAFQMASVYAENLGGGRFSLRPLPREVQTSVMMDLESMDINQDGHMDIIAVGNNYAPEALSGRMDAGNGWVMLGDGKGNFRSIPYHETGFFVQGDQRKIAFFKKNGNVNLLIASNEGPLQCFELKIAK